MGQYFVRDYTGGAFELFGSAHLIALAIIILINIIIYIARNRFTQSARRATRTIMAVVLIVNELAFHAWNYFTGQWTIQKMLPLHICSVLVWTGAYMVITSNHRIYEFAYFLGIGGATQALLTPDAGIYGFPHFRFIQTMVSHGLIVTSALYMTWVEGLRPTWSSFRRVFIYGNLYMLFVGIVNWLIGSNYMFIARKPDTPSLIDLLGPWPWYLISLELIALGLCILLYLPFIYLDRQRVTLGTAS
jgi:hypothetical integral membrane protein (TIGR02206 family)